jgi:thiamine transporter ThiT
VRYWLWMQIDHDPKELSHKAIKIVALLVVVVTIAIAVPVAMSMSWTMRQLPIPVLALFVGTMGGLSAGFFIGRWDALRGQRTPGSEG